MVIELNGEQFWSEIIPACSSDFEITHDLAANCSPLSSVLLLLLHFVMVNGMLSGLTIIIYLWRFWLLLNNQFISPLYRHISKKGAKYKMFMWYVCVSFGVNKYFCTNEVHFDVSYHPFPINSQYLKTWRQVGLTTLWIYLDQLHWLNNFGLKMNCLFSYLRLG